MLCLSQLPVDDLVYRRLYGSVPVVSRGVGLASLTCACRTRTCAANCSKIRWFSKELILHERV